MKSFNQVFAESTCFKRVTICEIYDRTGNLLSRESNRCNPPEGICQRINVSSVKDGYPLESSCMWTHAEIMAIKSIPAGSVPYSAKLYGHSFLCDNCESELKKVGVQVIEVIETIQKTT